MKKYILSCLTFLMLLSACKKVDHSTLLTAQEFPTSVGSWWQYQQLDISNNILDTAIVTITDIKTINGITWQRWVQVKSNSIYNDTMYIFATDTFIGFNNYPALPFAYETINFPVIDNKAWSPILQGISYSTGLQNITVNNISYNGAIYLNKSSPAIMGASINESYWIVKNIGLVEQLIDDPRVSYSHDILISYHIN